jgi:hypothetical protein
MTTVLGLEESELFSRGLAYERPKLKDRNLGGAIFLVAIDDYSNIDEEIHQDARDFCIPSRAPGRTSSIGQFRWPTIWIRAGCGAHWIAPGFRGMCSGQSV